MVSPGWDVSAGSGCLAISGDEFLKSLSTATLVGRLLTADAENPDDNSSLTVAGGNITDQSSFENRFRSWGMAGTWGEDAATGLCTDPSTCSIWDFGLSSSDTSIRNRSDTPGTENAKLSATSACPSVTLANKTLTDAFGGQFLKLAIEEAGDSIGDDDGLCETGETCIYTPSIGVDQGYDQFDGATFETCSQGESPALACITLKAYSNE